MPTVAPTGAVWSIPASATGAVLFVVMSTVSAALSEKVPIFERFFAGGATTIRGYRERSIGPDDENDEAIGGNTRIVLTSEIIIPLQKDIRFVTFFDMGDVYGADENIDFSTFRKGVGAGVRVSTPFGLLRFDWGYKLDQQDAYRDDEKDYEFHFGLGNIF